jgi:hypothetical protein
MAVLAVTVATGALLTPFVSVAPANATTYPTWADVKAAKANQSAKAAEVSRVQAALKSAQAEAAAKSQAALVASEAKDSAEAALASATRTASTLESQASAAAKTAARAKARAGQLAANLYRDGANNSVTTQIATSKNPTQLLYQLGALSQLSSTWAGVMDDASVAANTASSLHDQAQRAESQRQKLAVAAEQKSQAADEAEQVANAVVSTTQSHETTLYAQLASLQNTAISTARRYEIGVQVAAQVAEQKRRAALAAAAAAAAAAAPTSSSSSGSAAPTSTSYPSTAGVTVDPAAAQAYARSAIAGYGWDSSQDTCLVELWTQESGWRANALNVSSGAYGIPQALPADKMATAGADWRTNADTQINWGLAYIKDAYGSPCAAWNHEMSENPHWY